MKEESLFLRSLNYLWFTVAVLSLFVMGFYMGHLGIVAGLTIGNLLVQRFSAEINYSKALEISFYQVVAIFAVTNLS